MTKINYQDRRNTIIVIILVVGVVFLGRLFFIQIGNSKWKNEALKISETKRTIQPSRGLIYDRNGTIIAINKPAYKLFVTPKKTTSFDTTELCLLLDMDKDKFIAKLKDLHIFRSSKQLIKKNIPSQNIPKLNAILYRLKGFEVEVKSSRYYPINSAANILGYVREVSPAVIKKKPYYKPGDLIGITGIEKYYENQLRGNRGNKKYLKDAFGNLKEVLATNSARAGNNITSTIDIVLQQYGEKLMQNKIGGIVAIEPSTGEILAMISAPTYNANNLVTDSISKKFNPYLNRPLQSRYPPGSIFKMVQGLISLDVGAIKENTGLPCKKDLVGCHNHVSARNLTEAIKYSCNPYFYQTLGLMAHKTEGENIHIKSRKSLAVWNKYVKSFGLGTDLKLDIPHYNIGSIPSPKLYDNMYKKSMNWNYRTCNSISIGQGEILITPIQMANLAAIIANRGYYYYPHFIKNIKNDTLNSLYLIPNKTKVNKAYFPIIVNAMQQVVEGAGGTASRARVNGITVCGKTGTVQNPHGEDHSVFIAFAPKKNPKIAIAVYVENAGWGGSWAAPISSLMIEQYLTDSIQNSYKESRIIDANLIPKIQ